MWVIERIEQGVQAGEFEPCQTRIAAKAALGAINWLTVWYNPELKSTQQAIEQIADTIADFVTRGLRARRI